MARRHRTRRGCADSFPLLHHGIFPLRGIWGKKEALKQIYLRVTLFHSCLGWQAGEKGTSALVAERGHCRRDAACIHLHKTPRLIVLLITCQEARAVSSQGSVDFHALPTFWQECHQVSLT